MADLQREKDERIEKNPTSEANQGNLKKDDDSKKDEKNRDTGSMGRQDSNIGKGSTSTGSSGNLGSSQSENKGTSQTPGRDADKDKGGQSGMKR